MFQWKEIANPGCNMRHRIIATVVLLITTCITYSAFAESKKKTEKVTAYGCDGSVLLLTMLDDKLQLQTDHGLLTVPIHKIQGIDLATRIPVEMRKRINAAILALGSKSFRQREMAEEMLLSLEERAVGALQRATKAIDAEVARRAKGILKKLHETMDEERLIVRKQDVIYTKDSKLVGELKSPYLRVKTRLFGEQKLNIGDLYQLEFGEGVVRATPGKVLSNPGTLVGHQTQIGKKFLFTVTGKTNGSLWGTNMYTTDSTLAAAAVHAGVLKANETGVVEVTIHASPPGFQGSTRNGVTSGAWGVYTAAYTVKKVKRRR